VAAWLYWKTPPRGYENRVNWLTERLIEVTNGRGDMTFFSHGGLRPRRAGKAQLLWNSSISSQYPSPETFLEQTTRARRIVAVAVPDTPYAFYVLAGEVSPYFLDSERTVLWQIDSPQVAGMFHRTGGTVEVSPKKLGLHAGGGDSSASLVVDFSDYNDAPKIRYEEHFGPP
jgi:hypothetical protein